MVSLAETLEGAWNGKQEGRGSSGGADSHRLDASFGSQSSEVLRSSDREILERRKLDAAESQPARRSLFGSGLDSWTVLWTRRQEGLVSSRVLRGSKVILAGMLEGSERNKAGRFGFGVGAEGHGSTLALQIGVPRKLFGAGRKAWREVGAEDQCRGSGSERCGCRSARRPSRGLEGGSAKLKTGQEMR